MKESGSKRPWLVDVPVVLNFFVRPDALQATFDALREARPSVLFLVSDGPRSGVPSDAVNVARCRALVSNIDWECQVHRLYADNNMGLFDRYFSAMDRVFDLVDRAVFLEDDLVVARSFFRFCKEMLDRFENDLRVHFVTGFNHLGDYREPDGDYFFCGEGSIWGYAIWKRTYVNMNLGFRDNPYAVDRCMRAARQLKPGYEKRIARYVKDPLWEGHVPHPEFYKNFMRFSQNQIYVVPSRNMVSNIGVGTGSMHSADHVLKLPRASRRLFYSEVFELEFPIRHPEFVVRDLKFEELVNRELLWNMPIRQFVRKISSLMRAIIYRDFDRIAYKFVHLFVRDAKR